MKIAVLELKTVSKGDVPFDEIYRLGEVAEFPLTPAGDVVKNVGDAEAVLCNKTVFDEKVLRSCPNLKYIGLCATGYNNIDLKTCAELGITVCNVPAYSTAAVAQQVFSFILHFASKTSKYNKFVKQGGWVNSETFSAFEYPIQELAGKTVGIIGYGSIGRKVAKIAQAFDMKVIVNTRTARQDSSVKFVSIKELFTQADVITAHCPLNADTENLIRRETLEYCKPTCVIINTSRGAVVNEQDLADALNGGQIAGAALDVLRQEPMSAENPLLTAKNCIITPHIAWAPLETRQRLVKIAAENLAAYIAGKPVNVVTE
ncbi:MAG: D-2-hydroxyacid dehydrogenase [Ruminococcus sp.]|nr:D-2-hydroxyacid dehydrogenase [Ruminococcus sp.]MCM1380897.1 D-2-hydroxyacid dehydrogenase [Muribaculaceae bacterium]MCM1479180.1 D-2-hydroxyacid dehydrogenase [Muribaculaceae bacterium]